MKNYSILIIGMMLVTYLPRLIPMVTLSEKPIPPALRRFLMFIPYTALGALIIPGVAKATPQMPAAGLVGVGVAAIAAWFKGGLIIPVVASIAATFLTLYCFGG